MHIKKTKSTISPKKIRQERFYAQFHITFVIKKIYHVIFDA